MAIYKYFKYNNTSCWLVYCLFTEGEIDTTVAIQRLGPITLPGTNNTLALQDMGTKYRRPNIHKRTKFGLLHSPSPI